MYERVTLANGVRILVARMPHVRSVSIDLLFCVGARYEPAELGGVSHFIEHMLFKGTEQYPTAQLISQAVEGVGGVLDAATDKELTVYSAKIASRHFDLAMEVLGDMVLRPRLEPTELDKERRVIIEEINMYRDNPQDWVGVLADEHYWGDQPLGREVAGTRETVGTMTREALDAYRVRHYVPGNLVIAIAGDADVARVEETAQRLFGAWPAAPVPTWTPWVPQANTTHVKLEQRKTEQTNLCLTTPGVAYAHADYYAQALLNTILGEGMSSRLFVEVREQQGLAYEVGSGPTSFHDTGCFTVFAGVEPRRAAPALRAILAQMWRMAAEAAPEDELARAKEYTKGRMALRLEDTNSVAAWLGGQEALRGEILDLDTIMARFDAVTAADVQRLAGELFRPEEIRLTIIGPHQNPDEFDRLLVR